MANVIQAPSMVQSMIAPDLLAQQIQLQRRQQIIDMLRQQASDPIQSQTVQGGPGSPNIAVPVSGFQALAKVLQGGASGYMQQNADKQSQALYQAMGSRFAQALGGGGNPAPVLSGSQPTPPGISPSSAAMFGTEPSQDPQPQPDLQPAPQSAPQNNRFSMANILRGSIMSSIDPNAGAAFWKQTDPTDFTKQLMQAGIDPNSALGRQIMQQNLAKQNYIAPTRLANGAYADSNGNVQGLPAAAPAGYINVNGPGGWTTQPVSGGVQAAANSAGAVEGAKENAQIEMVKDASGRMVPVRMGDVVGQRSPAQQGTPPQGPAVQANHNAPAQFNFPGMSQQQILDQANSIKDPAEKAAFISRLQAAPPQNVNAADPWATMPRIQQPSGIGQSSYGEAIQKGQGEAAAKLSEKYGSLAEQANQGISLNNQALDLVNKADLGPGAMLTADVKNIIQKYVPGVSDSSFQNTPSASLALQKDLVNAATARAKQQFGSRITQSEVNLMLNRGSPNVNMPKAALEYLISSDNAVKNYNIQQANDLGKYLNNGGDPYRFEGWYANKFPMTNSVSQVQLGSQGQSGQPVKISGDSDYAKLPSGASYIAPDGSHRTKR